MTDLASKELASIASAVAVIVSLLSIAYTRKNIKTQKFIETITAQRIAWIDTLRNDLSQILASFYLMTTCADIVEGADQCPQEILDDLDLEERKQTEDNRDSAHNSLVELKKASNIINIINKIDASILRLNSKDDKHLIELLEKIRDRFAGRLYHENNDNKLIAEVRKSISFVLKNEWEKIKQEVKSGNISNDKSSFLP